MHEEEEYDVGELNEERELHEENADYMEEGEEYKERELHEEDKDDVEEE